MLTLEDDALVFRFPTIEQNARFAIKFQRTLRIPDTEKTYSLPPGLGCFPLRHTEDFAGRIPSRMLDRGGIVFPMWQTEAMWMNFDNQGPEWGLEFPVAIKIAAGKINAVSGEPWQSGIHRDPQDYVVSPEQPWLDGFSIGNGEIRQFVAMPLGDGYTPEEQLTGEAEWGGLQISVIPLKLEAWQRQKAEWEEEKRRREEQTPFLDGIHCSMMSCSEMGLAAGGRMRQEIYQDTFELEDWDLDSAERVFVSLVHAMDWAQITGEAPPREPITAAEYSAAGLPWFNYLDCNPSVYMPNTKLSKVKSVAQKFIEKNGEALPNSEDIEIAKTIELGQNPSKPRAVKTKAALE